MSDNVARFRTNLAHLAGKPCHLLEIGVFEGRATTWLLHNIATDDQSSMTCIEPYVHESFRANAAGVVKIKLLEGYSRDILPSLPRSHFDFIYVDGQQDNRCP